MKSPFTKILLYIQQSKSAEYTRPFYICAQHIQRFLSVKVWHKHRYLTAIYITIPLILSGCAYRESSASLESEITSEEYIEQKKEENKKETEINIGERLPITREAAAKMIALTFGTKAEINSQERTISFTDTSPENSYDKYINYACSKNYISGTGDKFMPEEYLSVIQAQYIIDQLDSSNKIKINITDETKNKPISYNLWTEIYMKILKNLSGKDTIKEKFGLTAQRAVILATHENNSLIKEGFTITDKGLLKCGTLDLEPYIDKEISFWTKENEIIALSDITSQNPKIKNVYITENNNSSCTIFSGGAEKTYEKASDFTQTETEAKIADITLTDKKISKIEFITNSQEKQIKSITEKTITSVDNETFDISEDCKVYYIQNEKTMLGSREDIIEGKTYELYIKDSKIQAFTFERF